MSNTTKKPSSTEKIVRVSKKDKGKLKGATNWAALVAEDKKENPKK
ncbi:MAG: hypothetical protein ACI4NJ_08330 [Cellvibrio sp.]